MNLSGSVRSCLKCSTCLKMLQRIDAAVDLINRVSLFQVVFTSILFIEGYFFLVQHIETANNPPIPYAQCLIKRSPRVSPCTHARQKCVCVYRARVSERERDIRVCTRTYNPEFKTVDNSNVRNEPGRADKTRILPSSVAARISGRN